MKEQISYAKTVYGEEEINAVVQCLKESTQMGKYSREFENKIAKIFNKKYCLYLNSGSSALYIGIEAFNFPEGSEVITPALTFSTTIGSLIKNKLVPVFTDIEPLTYCIDINQIEPLISDKTVAILAPNLLGNLCKWKEIRKIADKFGLKVIEDSADTIGYKIENKVNGRHSDIVTNSFYASHIINGAGFGGIVCFNDYNLYKKANGKVQYHCQRNQTTATVNKCCKNISSDSVKYLVKCSVIIL